MNQLFPVGIVLLLLIIAFLLVKIHSQLKFMTGIIYKTLNNTTGIDSINKKSSNINEKLIPIGEKLENIQNILGADRAERLGFYEDDDE